MLRIIVFVVLIVAGNFVSITTAVADPQTDSLLSQLNQLIEQKEKYVNAKLARLETLHRDLASIPGHKDFERYELLKALAEEYKTFIYDSAFSTLNRLQRVAYRLNDPVKIAYAKVQLGLVLLSSGMFKETLDSLETLDVAGLPDSIRLEYYYVMARSYYDLGDFDKDRYYTPHYNKLGTLFIDSAKSLCKTDSYDYLYLNGLKNLKNENTREALSDLNTLLTKYNLNHHQVAVTASTLSYFYISRNEPDEAIHLLARAAIADMLSATKETAAMYALAELLYKKGDIKNAYNYIQQAMEDASFYGARQRKVQVGSIMPVITSAKVNNVEEQRRIALIYAGVITLLTVLVIVFALSTLRQLKKRKIAERALQEANKIKEEYIGYYFNINSEYLGKIESFKKSVEMKLMTKKMDDIKFIVNNINPKKEREELYHSFDKVFLKLFPDFVKVFNSYFKEEDRVVLKEGQLLNTELRIFALIRMGIHDNEKIAKILDYSINTIYNYKARVKGKSLIPNEEFEKKVMEIHAL
jgi:tetratricopeptide (TPR) repeat protein